jgi:hypothetical protein
MVTVAVMHEQVHERAKQQGQPDKHSEQMGTMFHPQINSADCQEANQDQPRRRG